MKKKIFILVFGIIAIFLSFGKVHANNLIGLKSIEYTTSGGFEKIKLSFVGNIGEVTAKRFNNPERIVVDFSEAELRLKDTSIDVNSSQIIKIRSGQFMPTVARVVVDLKKDVKYSVTKDGRYYIISIPISGSTKNDNVKEKTEPDKKDIIANKNQEKNDNRDLLSKEVKQENKKENESKEQVKLDEKELPPKEVEQQNKKENENKDGEKPDKQDALLKEEKQESKKLNKVFVEYKRQGEYEVAKIKISNYKGYNVFRLKNPDRIVVDIPKGCFEEGSNTIRVDGRFIKSIRSNNFTKDVARVILDVLKSPSYEVLEEKDGLKILVKGTRDSNDTAPGKIQYILAGDRVGLRINKIGFTNNEGFNISNYTYNYDKKNKTYTIVFDKDIANLKNEVLKINDDYIDRIEVSSKKKKTKIVFFAKDNFLYEVISRKSARDTIILILRKATKKKSLVVIDAGHGGKEDPGAVCNLLSEKSVNLDIALRVEECLKKKGISTYMTRKSDLYLSEYERANIANRLNASLFVCIHNNTYEGQAKGTETLYNPNNSDESVSIKNKKFASIMQKNIVKALGTLDRGIKERPNLAVLRKTTMPGVLVEVAFLTDSNEFKLLNDGSFKQKAAQSIADAIEEMLKSEGQM